MTSNTSNPEDSRTDSRLPLYRDESEKPFYLRQPFNFLLDPIKFKKLNPWDINLDVVLRDFYEKMTDFGNVDFRLSGRMLFSASTLYKQKVQDLSHKIERQEKIKKLKKIEIPQLDPPVKPSSARVPLSDLINALENVVSVRVKQEKALKERRRPRNKTALPDLLLPTFEEMYSDEATDELSEVLHDIFNKIVRLKNENNEITFEDLIDTKDLETIAQYFLAILYLSFEGVIDIRQEEPFSTIYIKLQKEDVSVITKILESIREKDLN